MPGYFVDTSALAKLYHRENGSLHMVRLLDTAGSAPIVSRLNLLEIESVFSIKLRTGEIDLKGQETCRRMFYADLAHRRIEIGPCPDTHHYLQAQQLLVRFGNEFALRTLDALQLATALALQKTGSVFAMVCADQKLCRVSEMCGLGTVVPRDS